MERLKAIIKRLPPLYFLIKERDQAISDKNQLLKERAYLIEERDRLLADSQDFFLKEAKGVIHIGANLGQERELYAKYNLEILWVEPISNIFLQLQENLKPFPRQHALNYLLTDVDNKAYDFHIASNAGASSSIFNFGKHQEIWPEVNYLTSVILNSITFSTLVEIGEIDVSRYDSLVLDTQGAELLVLRGARDLLRNFRFIKAEAADFESYEGCNTLDDLEDYLDPLGFKEVSKKRFAAKGGVGNYYDVIFERMSDPGSNLAVG